MEQSIEERGGDDRIAEHLAPFGKAVVGGEDHGAAFIAGVDQLEEQVAAAGDDRQVADLVDDQQGRSAEEADALRQTALALGAGELAEQLGEGAEVDAAPGLHGLDAEGSRQVTFAGAGRAEEVDHLRAPDNAELSAGEDTVAVEGWVEGAVEPGEGQIGRGSGRERVCQYV